MTKHVVPHANWHMHLADLIETAEDGDEIVVASEFVLQLAERTRRRMCPDKNILFSIEEEASPPTPHHVLTPQTWLLRFGREEEET